MRVFLVSLQSSLNRKKRVEPGYIQHGIRFEYFNAVVGADVDRENDSRIFNGEEFELVNNCVSKVQIKGKLTDGELGCALSHLKIYEKIVRDSPEGAIICEDDVLPQCNFVDLVDRILVKQPDAQLIHLGTVLERGLRQGWFNPVHSVDFNEQKYHYIRAGIPGFDWFFNRRRRISNTACYYISHSGAERLLKLGYPVRMEADRLTGMVAYNKLKIYIVVKQVAQWQNDMESDIGGGRHQKAY